MADEIQLTGRVLDWDDVNGESATIRQDEAQEYESKGYMVETIGDVTFAVRFLPFDDGDIQIQPKSDMLGRMAMAGGHANWGYSGRFVGFVYLKGKRRRLVDWWTLFPNDEHHFAAQQDKRRAEDAIRARIECLTRTRVIRVRGGYAFDPMANDERQKSKSVLNHGSPR